MGARGLVCAAVLLAGVSFLLLLETGLGPLVESSDGGSGTIPTASLDAAGQGDPAERATVGFVAGPLVAEAERRALEGERAPSAADVLEDYWGPEWPEVRERLASKGIDLDAPLKLAPWAEVEPMIAERMMQQSETEMDGSRSLWLRWPEELDADWMREHFQVYLPLDAIDFGTIETLAEPFQAELRPLVEQYLAELNTSLRHAWMLGRYERSPYTTDALPDRELTAFTGKATAQDGWAVRMGLEPGDYPELVELRNRMREIRHARNRTIRSWLADRASK